MLKAKIKNFTKDELACNCCGLLNMADYHKLAIQVLRVGFNAGLNVSSGCRCVKHNKNEGGHINSRHECETKEADATDLCPNYPVYVNNDLSNEEYINEVFRLYEYAKSLKVFKEVIMYLYLKDPSKSFVHVSTYPQQKHYDEFIKVIN